MVPDWRPSRPLSRGPTLLAASGPIEWHGAHFRNEVSPAAASWASAAPVDTTSPTAATNATLISHPPGHLFRASGMAPLKALPTTNAPPRMVRMALLRPPVNGESLRIGAAPQCLSDACRPKAEPAPRMSISSGCRSALEHFSINLILALCHCPPGLDPGTDGQSSITGRCYQTARPIPGSSPGRATTAHRATRPKML